MRSIVKSSFNIFIICLMLCAFCPGQAEAAEGDVFSQDTEEGRLFFSVTDEEKSEAAFIGMDQQFHDEFAIPSEADNGSRKYAVTSIMRKYVEGAEIRQAYVDRLVIPASVTGGVSGLEDLFYQLSVVEFKGVTAPHSIYFECRGLANGEDDCIFIVPEGSEEDYRKIFSEGMYFCSYSDLYEKNVLIDPVIVNNEEDSFEYGIFVYGDRLYRVTSYASDAKNGIGEVELIGYYGEFEGPEFTLLPEIVESDGHSYKLTRLTKYSLIGERTTAVVIPDTVTEMEDYCCDKFVEVLFLSKNCPVIGDIITDENDESSLRFVYIPEGVTTINDYAFRDFMINKAEVIIPKSVASIGKKALEGFSRVEFLGEEPTEGLYTALNRKAVIAVSEKAEPAYTKALEKLSRVSFVRSEKTVPAKKMTVTIPDDAKMLGRLILKMSDMYQLKTAVNKASNEKLYYLSSNEKCLEIDENGVLNPKGLNAVTSPEILIYTRYSGKYKTLIVCCQEVSFSSGMFSYNITSAKDQTVNLWRIKPKKSTKKIVIPETVEHEGITYTVTSVLSPDYEDSGQYYSESVMPLIINASKYSFTELIFPKTISGGVGYLGDVRSLKSITFLGEQPPEQIAHWYLDGSYMAYNTVIYVPKGCVEAYESIIIYTGDYDNVFYEKYGCSMTYNIVRIGSKQPRFFEEDGIIYTIRKYAGKRREGKAAVFGVDVSIKSPVLPETVKHGDFTYVVTNCKTSPFLNK